MDKIFAFVRMAVTPGETENFRRKAHELLELVRTDLAGTQAYEWFLTADGGECTVIEIYDDAEAFVRHGRVVGKAIASLKQHVETEVVFAGGISPEMFEHIKERMPKAGFAGSRIRGLLRSASSGTVSTEAGTRILALAQFSIKPGLGEEFVRLADECFAIVDRNEPGTLGYEWFLNEAGTECLTLDIYRDTAALAAHVKNAGPTMAKILDTVESDVRLYGALPPEAQARLNRGLSSRFVATQLQGIF